MDAYIQTVVGIFVSVILFLIGYKQTIGARKERVQAANKAVHRALLRRMVLEDYKPRVKDIGRMLEGKAREFKISSADLYSEEQILNQLFSEIFDNDFITPDQRVNMERRIDEVFEDLIREKEPVERTETVLFEERATKNRYIIAMGLATSILGTVTAVVYTLTKAQLFPTKTDLSDLKMVIPVIGVFFASLAAVAAISVLKRTRETTEETGSRRTGMMEGAELEKEIAAVLQQLGYTYQVEPVIGNMRPDFLITLGSRKLAIEAKAWRTPPPLHFVARVRDYAKAILATKVADEILIVTKARAPITENMDTGENIRFLTVRELSSYLQQKKKNDA